MRQLVLLLVVFLCAAAGVAVLLYTVAAIRKSRPSERRHMDPLPPALRLIWPAVDVLQFHASETVPTAWLVRRRRQLQLAGLEFTLKAEEFIAVQFICAVGLAATGLGLAALLHAGASGKLGGLGAGMAVGWVLPLMWMHDVRKRREREILRTLPSYLDMITLCCQAGLSLTGAIAQAVDKGPRGALRTEFDRMMRDMRAGMSRSGALRALSERTDNRHISSLVSNLIQTETLGASMSDTLVAISDQRRTERFHHAEKLAMEAPVKMIGPLIIFIFPVTFIIIFFPLVMQFLEASR